MSKAEELARRATRRNYYGYEDLHALLDEVAAELRRLDALEKEGNDYLTIAYLSGHSKGVADTKAKLEQAAEIEADAKRYLAIRNADRDLRNRIKHYSGSALDVFIDAVMKEQR
jgi:hypothetical protein